MLSETEHFPVHRTAGDEAEEKPSLDVYHDDFEPSSPTSTAPTASPSAAPLLTTPPSPSAPPKLTTKPSPPLKTSPTPSRPPFNSSSIPSYRKPRSSSSSSSSTSTKPSPSPSPKSSIPSPSPNSHKTLSSISLLSLLPSSTPTTPPAPLLALAREVHWDPSPFVPPSLPPKSLHHPPHSPSSPSTLPPRSAWEESNQRRLPPAPNVLLRKPKSEVSTRMSEVVMRTRELRRRKVGRVGSVGAGEGAGEGAKLKKGEGEHKRGQSEGTNEREQKRGEGGEVVSGDSAALQVGGDVRVQGAERRSTMASKRVPSKASAQHPSPTQKGRRLTGSR